ncbi:MAG: glycosyltransferase [Candidatus Omnitrophica bacterium]|nr:glycosyltransferase [Candidatus Omnitrophota bacterium]
MSKILVIPHHPVGEATKIRLGELAKFLSLDNEVYLFNWIAAEGEYTFKNRLKGALKDILKKQRIYKKFNLNIVEFPVLHRPLKLVPLYNSFWLKRFLEKNPVDIVINGSYYMFHIAGKRNFSYVFDIADLPMDEENNNFFSRFIDSVVKKEVKKADVISVVSHGLVDYVGSKYRQKADFVPNGADLERIRAVKNSDVAKLKEKYNLKDKWIIGYIGYIGDWVEVEFMSKVLKELKKKIPDACLLWIGSAPNTAKLSNVYAHDGVIFTGAINEEIEPYFKLLDVGIIPHVKCLFQDMAFHIKLIEYTAAGKMVVSSPITEVLRINFPNVRAVDFEVDLWVKALLDSRNTSWDQLWDNLTQDYGWKNICRNFLNIIEREKSKNVSVQT